MQSNHATEDSLLLCLLYKFATKRSQEEQPAHSTSGLSNDGKRYLMGNRRVSKLAVQDESFSANQPCI